MAGRDNTGTDARQVSQNPASSGGSGGIFGNASAAIGDVGIGTSASDTGDLVTNTSKTYTFGAPTINKTDYTKPLIIAGVLFFVYKFAKNRGIL